MKVFVLYLTASTCRSPFMKPYIFILTFLVSSLNISAQAAKNIYFPVDSARLSEENVDLLQKYFDGMGPGYKSLFRVLIHDDAKNRAAINELDRKRSLALVEFFLREGVPESNVKIIKTPGREAKGFISDEMKNLMIFDVEVYLALPSIEFSACNDIDLLNEPAQSFTLSLESESKIKGAGGTMISFPAGAFEFKTGLPATKLIKIELREFLKPSEISSAGLMTMSDEIPLSLAGIIWIKASCGNKEVRLRKDKQAQISFPGDAEVQDARLFTGIRSDGLLNLHAYDPVAPAAFMDHRFTMSVSLLHWIACAGYDKSPAKGSLAIKTSATYPLAGRLILCEEHKVYAAHTTADSKDLLFAQLPLGKKAILVVYGEKDGKIYVSSKEILTSADAKEKLTLKESGFETLKSTLKGAEK
jgi:hypothetical protein